MNQSKAYLALLVICIVWGTTYLAMLIGVASFPAFLFSGLRHTIAATILWLSMPLLKKKISLNARDIMKQVIPGVLMLALGNGTIGWAEKYIPSGLAALIVSVMPVYVVLINFVTGRGKGTLNGKIILGLLLGCAGIVLIFKDNLGDLLDTRYLMGVLVCFAASLSWAAGTVYMKHSGATTDSYVNTAIQLSSGGLALLISSPFLDDLGQLQHIEPESLWALAYLIVFGSILSFLCYIYAIKNLPVGLVSIYAYINPFIAVSLGFLLKDERVTWITVIAFATTLGGVFWINRGYKVNNQLKPVSK
ncbi:DMT family transporter [Taibaiella koreensis]|uniref:DMT family transporter n=1 Tax=Taibaiella koreensis TaxID=1268548 RepID=UPI000E59DFFC|nr:EamA family transporter [Taibaiella koreensis]